MRPHLDQIGQRALAAVVLPVGVGDEGDRRVEGEILGNRGLSGRVERQKCLQPHQPVDEREAADMAGISYADYAKQLVRAVNKGEIARHH